MLSLLYRLMALRIRAYDPDLVYAIPKNTQLLAN